MTMPPLPTHPDVHTFRWTMSELDAIEAYGKACHQAALDEVLAKIEAMRIPKGEE